MHPAHCLLSRKTGVSAYWTAAIADCTSWFAMKGLRRSRWVYPGPDCHGSVYVDDGETLNYTKGDFSRTELTCAVSSDGIDVTIERSEGPLMPWWIAVQVHVVGLATQPKSVTLLNAVPPKWAYDPATQMLTADVPRGASAITLQLRTR